jgi:hypothetical protein
VILRFLDFSEFGPPRSGFGLRIFGGFRVFFGALRGGLF